VGGTPIEGDDASASFKRASATTASARVDAEDWRLLDIRQYEVDELFWELG
jgi:hypothetical protein